MSPWVTRPGAKASPWPGEADGRAGPSRDGQARPHLHPGPPHRLQPICAHTDLELAGPAGHLSQAPGCLLLTQPAPRCCPTVPLFLWVSASPQGGHSRSRRHYSPSRREGACVRSWAPASCGMGCASVFSQLTPPSPPGGPLCPFLAPRGFPTGWLRDNPSLLMDVPPENC